MAYTPIAIAVCQLAFRRLTLTNPPTFLLTSGHCGCPPHEVLLLRARHQRFVFSPYIGLGSRPTQVIGGDQPPAFRRLFSGPQTSRFLMSAGLA